MELSQNTANQSSDNPSSYPKKIFPKHQYIPSCPNGVSETYKSGEIENWFKRCMNDVPKSWINSYFGIKETEYEVKPSVKSWEKWFSKWFSQFSDSSPAKEITE